MTAKRPADRRLARLLRIIDLGRWLAPPSRRREWRRQWRADIWHEWQDQHDREPGIGARATLVARTIDALRHAWRLRLHVRQIEMISHDMRYGWRSLTRSPIFTLVAVATLALGIGANTTVFSLMNAVLLRPLAAHDPERVIRIVPTAGTGAAGASSRRFSFRDYVDYRERATTVDDLSAVNLATVLLDADNRTDQLLGEIASGRYQSLLGARAVRGRMLVESDDAPSAPPVAVISEPLWHRRFGGEPVLGRTILLNRQSFTIVGVADASFIGSFVAAPVDIWISINSSGRMLGDRWQTDRAQRTLALMGRLRPGVARGQAQQELQSIATAIAREFTPDLHPTVAVAPGTLVSGDQRRLLTMFLSLLLGLVALVLVIAAANVANMLLARVVGRRRELAIRVALGASRGQLARMLIVESSAIAAAGGAAALLLSLWTSRLFANISPLPTLTLRLDVRPDLRVVLFTAGAAILAAALLGVVATLQAVRPAVVPALKEDAANASPGSRPRRVRAGLAALQVTVSLILVIGAALFLRSVREAAQVDLGFDPRGVVAMDIDASNGRDNAESIQLFHGVLQRLSEQRRGDIAAISTRAPLDSSTPLVRVSAQEAVSGNADDRSPTASFLVVSPHFFDVVKTPIVSGRAFTDRDDEHAPMVAVVNETLAARLWPNETAIGRRLWLEAAASPAPCIVVGISKDSKYLTLGEPRRGHVYLPFAQHPRRGMALLVRSLDAPDRVAAGMQAAVQSVDPTVQGFFTRTLEEHVGVSMLPVRLAAGLTTVVAALALGLALVGLYSLVSFLVAERTHEIGLRMALGARAGDVLRLVIGYGFRLAGAGLVVGIPVALAASRLLNSLLYGVNPADPVIFSVAAVALLFVSLLACCVPALRAVRVDPLTALKQP
jgi:predicted permease